MSVILSDIEINILKERATKESKIQLCRRLEMLFQLQTRKSAFERFAFEEVRQNLHQMEYWNFFAYSFEKNKD